MLRTSSPWTESGQAFGVSRIRTCLRAESRLSASAEKPGAWITSQKVWTMAWATSTPTGRLNATTPPKAEAGSPAWALRKASSGCEPRPTPQGLLCLTMTAEGAANWNTSLAAVSTSSRLL